MSRPVFISVAWIVLLVAGCGPERVERGSGGEEREDLADEALRDFRSLDSFRSRFDADSAHPRLVLLLSPT